MFELHRFRVRDERNKSITLLRPMHKLEETHRTRVSGSERRTKKGNNLLSAQPTIWRRGETIRIDSCD